MSFVTLQSTLTIMFRGQRKENCGVNKESEGNTPGEIEVVKSFMSLTPKLPFFPPPFLSLVLFVIYIS